MRVRLLLDDGNTRGPRSDARGARRASEHRGAPLQPVREPRLARGSTSDRLRAPQPAHAQQVVHRRQPGGDRRRPQHRRRILRGGRRRSRSPTSTCSPSGAVVREVSTRVRPATGTARRPIRAAPDRRRAGASGAAQVRERRASRLGAEPGGERLPRSRARDAAGAALLDGALPLEWTAARVVHDDPDEDPATRTSDATCSCCRELQAGDSARRAPSSTSSRRTSCRARTAPTRCVALAARGVRVRILTNSLAATDVGPVHAGYAKRREATCCAAACGCSSSSRDARRAIRSRREIGEQLHGRPARQDVRRRPRAIFVGSFNFDPRSAQAEHRDGPASSTARSLAQRLVEALDNDLPDMAYEPRIASDGRCPVWIERTPTGEVVHDVEPETGFFRRAMVRVLSILPIEWLL